MSGPLCLEDQYTKAGAQERPRHWQGLLCLYHTGGVPSSSTLQTTLQTVWQVQRIDVTSEKDGEDLQWIVERQYQEFYSLQTALVQYHGVFEDVKLPPRSKMFGGKGLDVLQSKIEPFQDFLVKLLLKPNLKKSDLLFTFLTTRQVRWSVIITRIYFI